MNAIMKPNCINLNNFKYYNVDDLNKYDSAYFYGCSRTLRKIIEKKNINEKNYLYATWSKKNGWMVSPDQKAPSNKAKLLLNAEWTTQNIPKMQAHENNYEYQKAPNIIELDDSEKFKDSSGNPVDIETRGERNSKDIYFSAKDVSRVFELESIERTLLRKERGYIINTHYKTFISTGLVNDESQPHKQLFITYIGMLKILFSSRSGNPSKFIEWAADTLFTVQMGSSEQKEELVSGIIGIPAKSLRQVLKANATSTPCVYRFALGTAKDLRKILNLPNNIPDNYIIIKYGFTDDLVRRTSEHVKTYGKYTKNLELMNYAYIDPKYLSQAECDVKEFFNTIETPIECETFKELVAINPEHEKTIKRQFKYLHSEYAGAVSDLIEKIELLKRDIESKNKEIAHLKEIHTLLIDSKDKELLYANKTHLLEIQNKDLMIQLLKS